jgi:hypothetical protein
MSRGPDAATLFRRAIELHADRCGLRLTWHLSAARRWASATFVGAQHRIALSVEGDGVDAWIALLDEVDFPLKGHLVADLVVATIERDGERASLGLEVLTVES